VFGIQKGYFHGNARTDRCIGSNNRDIVILTGVFTVTTEGSMRSNGRRYKKIMHSKGQSSEGRRRKQSSIGRDVVEAVIVILQAIIIVKRVIVEVNA
jgi:hypothetical protein